MATPASPKQRRKRLWPFALVAFPLLFNAVCLLAAAILHQRFFIPALVQATSHPGGLEGPPLVMALTTTPGLATAVFTWRRGGDGVSIVVWALLSVLAAAVWGFQIAFLMIIIPCFFFPPCPLS
jgi:hypothetical protein